MHVCILEVHNFFGLTCGAIVKKDEQIMLRNENVNKCQFFPRSEMRYPHSYCKKMKDRM